MSPLGLIVIALAVLWMASMLVAGLRYSANARAGTGTATARPARAQARTYAAVRRRRD